MIIKEIDTQGFDENGERLYLCRDSTKYSPEAWKMILRYLKRNAEANLLEYEVIAP